MAKNKRTIVGSPLTPEMLFRCPKRPEGFLINDPQGRLHDPEVSFDELLCILK